MQHHIEDDDSVDSQPGHVTPDSQSRSLCTGSDLIPTNKDPRRMCIWWGMRARTLKIRMNKWCYSAWCHESECWWLPWSI